jgi:hypothetical protein
VSEPKHGVGSSVRNPIRMALAVGTAGAILILATCLGCGGLIALASVNAPKPTPFPSVSTQPVPTTPAGATGGTP